MFGSELEFFLFKETLRGGARERHFRPDALVRYILDYHVLATSYDEPFLRAAATAWPLRASRSRARRARPGLGSTR